MPGAVPPIIEPPKSVIGVGGREFAILGVTVGVVILILVIPMDMVLKIGFGVLLGGLGVALAFGREPKSGKTLEQYLTQMLNFYGRSRFHQRGASAYQPQAQQPIRLEKPRKTEKSERQREPQPVYSNIETTTIHEPSAITIRPLPLGGGLIFSIVSIAFFAALMTWLWGGGLQEILFYMNAGFSR
jgi:hypothetical protein